MLKKTKNEKKKKKKKKKKVDTRPVENARD